MKTVEQTNQNSKEKKLNEIIEYFHNWRERLYGEYLKEDYHQKHMLSVSISSAAVFVAIISPLMVYIFFAELNKIILVMVSALLILMCYNTFHFIYFSWKIEKRYSYKIIGIDVILDFLWHIKISGKNKGIDILIKEFSKAFGDYRRSYVKEYESIKIDEFVGAVDKLNSLIVKGEKNEN